MRPPSIDIHHTSMKSKHSEVTVTLPDQLFLLEEANLPLGLARFLVGRTVPVRLLPEKPDKGQPVGVRFTNPEDRKVWRFPRRWFGLAAAFSEPQLDSSYS